MIDKMYSDWIDYKESIVHINEHQPWKKWIRA